jgi:hypothetical protein
MTATVLAAHPSRLAQRCKCTARLAPQDDGLLIAADLGAMIDVDESYFRILGSYNAGIELVRAAAVVRILVQYLDADGTVIEFLKSLCSAASFVV